MRLLNEHEAAAITALELSIVRLCAESGLIAPQVGYDAAELAELRRVRRLMVDLELNPPALEVVLRMRARMLALLAEVEHLRAEVHTMRRRPWSDDWLDADWTD